jgi:[acyl-carrier-protein] S-malonyltransferase
MVEDVMAVFAPGQGAQSPGMLSAWLELPGAREFVGTCSDAIGLDLARLGTTADADEIKDTAVTQPLLVTAGVLAAHYLELDEPGERVVAGHSVGELTAAAVSGALTASEAVAFAGRRGAEMAAACASTPTSMMAVLGGDADDVVAAIEAAGLTAANRNGNGQIVAAGSVDDLAGLADKLPEGARARPLQVAGAFHTHYMKAAEEALHEYAGSLQVADPRPILLSNADGTAVSDGADLRDRLARQVTLPVRWDLCLRSCLDLGVTGVVELAPGGVLAGIAKRELPGAEIVAVKSPDDLAKARTLIASRAEHGQGEHMLDFRVVVTPAKGVFVRAEAIDEGVAVARGARLGTVRTNREEHAIIAPAAGVLAEWLRNDGDIVPAGLPVARLSAEN